MLYVIPFVVLLLILLVLKKRENTNKEVAEKTSNKKSNKKTAKKSTVRSRQSQTTLVEDPVVVQTKSTPLAPEFKKNIERLISEKNYFSAEAKINQALNQDNSQHELYLYLLDVHQAHKDDLAIDQLLNHIRSLGLGDIAERAESKQRQYEELVKASHSDAIEFPTADQPAVQAPAQQTQNTAAFDALVNPSAANNTANFDQLHDTLNTTTAEPVAPVQPLEFTIPEPTPVVEPQAEIKPLDFNFSPSTESAPQVLVETPAPVVEEIKPLEFSFDLESKSEAAPIIPAETVQPIEPVNEFKLDFDAPVAPVTEESAPVTAPELEFKLEAPATPAVEEVVPQDLDFKLDVPASEPAALPTLDLNFDLPVADTIHSPTTETAAPLQLDSAPVAAPQVQETVSEPTLTSTDPLAQSFPQVLTVNDAELNLELAERYIDLGAYDSARQLLAQNQDQYSASQRELSAQLLNRMAS